MENLWVLGSQQIGPQFSASAVSTPLQGSRRKIHLPCTQQVIIPQVSFSQMTTQFWNKYPGKNNKTITSCYGAYSYSAGTWHWNLHPAGQPISFCRCTQEPMSAQLTQDKLGRGFGKNANERTKGYKLARKKSLAVSVACMAIYWLTPGCKGRTFQLCVLNRWDYFCIHSSTLWGAIQVELGASAKKPSSVM